MINIKNHCLNHITPEMMLIDYMCQEKKKEEDLTALPHWYNLKTT